MDTLEVNEISFSYGSEAVLDQLSAIFNSHQIYGILGANGAGKTTLFRLIYGLLSPRLGEIQYCGKKIEANNIAYLETKNYFYPYMKGREYIHLLSHANTRFNIDLWNDIFKLPLDGVIDTYSAGMKKKLALLGTLALDRRVILLDEPFNSLDLETAEYFNGILKELKKKDKIIIMTSHILQVLKKNCDQISFLHHGNFQQTFCKPDFEHIDEIINENIMKDSNSILRNLFDK